MFLGDHGLPFAHTVTTAYYVSVPEFSALCEKAGFTVEEVTPAALGGTATTWRFWLASRKINAPHD